MYQHHSNVRNATPQNLEVPGVSIRPLWSDAKSGALTVVTEMQPGAVIPKHRHTHADETVYVLEGDFIEDGAPHGPGSYFVGAKGTWHGPHTTKTGCKVLTHFSASLDFVVE